MKRKLILVILLFILCTTSCGKIIKNQRKESDKVSSIKVVINNVDYTLNLENNKTVDGLKELLPLDLKMKELNGNEKYVYLDTTLSTNQTKVKKINKGDVMLYGDNCLVIFYKSFDTSYSYTKIGHIDNLPSLDSGDVLVKIQK